MGNMYGNITQHIPRTDFKFAAVYPSRYVMALDEKIYWNHNMHSSKSDYKTKNGATPMYKVNLNDYVLVNYTVPNTMTSGSGASGSSSDNLAANIYENNKASDVDVEKIMSYAYKLNSKGEIQVDSNGNFILMDGKDSSGNKIYNEYYEDLAKYGGVFAPGDYHMTVWQKQQLAQGKNSDGTNARPTYVAVARLHSIIPTFGIGGTYNIDLLDPLSSNPDAFGYGKNNTIVQRA